VNERQKQLETFLRELEAAIDRPGITWNIFCQFCGVSPTVLNAALAPIMARRESEDGSNAMQDQLLRLQNQISLMEDEQAKLKLELAEADEELTTLRGKRLDTKQIKEQTTQLEKEKNLLVVEVARLEALLNTAGEAQHDLNLLKEDNTKLKSEYSLLESERNDLNAALIRLEEVIDSLRREVARLEDENQKMQNEISRLQRQLESNPNEDALRAEISNLKRDKGALELEIARLETAQQSAAAYGASVLAKLEKVEKEKAQQLMEAKTILETEILTSNGLRERIAILERELQVARDAVTKLAKEVENANDQTQKAIAANQLLNASIEGEESELGTLRKTVSELQQKLSKVTAEYELLLTKSNAGDDAIEIKLEQLNKQVIEFRTQSETNANIKMKLAARVDTLVAENLHLKEKNLSLERRLKLLQGD